jgi:hypothetical protein
LFSAVTVGSMTIKLDGATPKLHIITADVAVC